MTIYIFFYYNTYKSVYLHFYINDINHVPTYKSLPIYDYMMKYRINIIFTSG